MLTAAIAVGSSIRLYIYELIVIRKYFKFIAGRSTISCKAYQGFFNWCKSCLWNYAWNYNKERFAFYRVYIRCCTCINWCENSIINAKTPLTPSISPNAIIPLCGIFLYLHCATATCDCVSHSYVKWNGWQALKVLHRTLHQLYFERYIF